MVHHGVAHQDHTFHLTQNAPSRRQQFLCQAANLFAHIVIPEFQREFVWTIKQSSLLIDSFLRGLPVPPVFFYIDEDNKNLVIDGQQRILSVVFFMEGYFGRESTHGKRAVFRLRGIGEKNPYLNKRFVDLVESDQRKLKQTVLRAVNIRQLRPKGEG